MNPVISLFLRNLSLILSDPALGYRGTAVRSVLNAVAAAVDAGEEGESALGELTAQVEQMAALGNDPFKEDFMRLKIRSEAAYKRLTGTLEEYEDEENSDDSNPYS